MANNRMNERTGVVELRSRNGQWKPVLTNTTMRYLNGRINTLQTELRASRNASQREIRRLRSDVMSMQPILNAIMRGLRA